METPTDDYLTTSEVARRLGVSRSTVTRMVADGKLEPTVRAPGYRGPFLFDPALLPEVVGA